jgi:uncharacterized protein (TIGR03083 family)
MEVVMNEWNATGYAAKDNLLRVVHAEAEGMFEMAGAAGAWERPTACPMWQVRDIVGHLIDVTEGYFTGFDAARSGAAVAEPLGLRVMADRLDEGARAHRDLTQQEALDRLSTDFAKLVEICQALGPDEWGGTSVTHKYMGPLPAFFYPVFQLMDYGVHGWDIRQGTGQAHGLTAETADLLVPFMFILWQATASVPASFSPGFRAERRGLPGQGVTRRAHLRARRHQRPARCARIRPGQPGADRLRPDERGHDQRRPEGG